MAKIVAAALVCFVGVCAGCGAQDGAEDGGTRAAEEKADTTPQSFAVPLNRTTTEGNVIQQILAAGREQIATVCEAQPDGAVRIYNPLASGAYEDVPCASVLDSEGATGEASVALANDESDGPIGTAQQGVGPISVVACGLAGIGTSLFTRYALCPRAKTPLARQNCEDTGLWGTIGIGIICMIPF